MGIDVFAGSRARAPVGLGIARGWRVLRSSVRLDEVLVLQGTPLLGALLSIGTPRPAMLPALALFTIGSGCLVAHVFLLNDWAGLETDRRDPNRTPRVPAAEGVPRRTLGSLSVVALFLTFLLLGTFGTRTLAIALAIAGLSAIYSIGPWAAKGVPVLGSFLHLGGGVLHFHLGYALFGTFGGRSLALSTFFAATFAAGHLMQEVRDHDADLLNGIRTSAVAFGRTAAFAGGLVLFALADALLVAMALRDVVPRGFVLAAPFFVLHLGWSLETLRAGLTFESVRRLRRRYRGLYVLIGMLMLAASIASAGGPPLAGWTVVDR
jgi:4-hydroxybenzoate polyprenyltransferase